MYPMCMYALGGQYAWSTAACMYALGGQYAYMHMGCSWVSCDLVHVNVNVLLSAWLYGWLLRAGMLSRGTWNMRAKEQNSSGEIKDRHVKDVAALSTAFVAATQIWWQKSSELDGTTWPVAFSTHLVG